MIKTSIFFIIWMLFHAFNSFSWGRSDNIINFQGRVNVNGNPFDGMGSFKFALLNEAGTVTLWSNDGTSVDGSEPSNAVQLNVSKGLFRVSLGKASIENMAPISDEVVAKNAKLRVWFNSGSNGWQRLQPDHEYSPSSFSVRSTKAETAGLEAAAEARIRSMEDTFVLNELDDHAIRGLSKPLISSNLVWESFPVPTGSNGRVSAFSDGSYLDQQIYAMSFGVQDLNQVSNSESVKKILTINKKVHLVEAEFYFNWNYLLTATFRFKYSDSTSADINIKYLGPDSWRKLTAINPEPTKIVLTVEIYFPSPTNLAKEAMVKNAKVAILIPASVTVTLSPQSENWVNFRANIHGAREVGDDVKFSITDGSTTLSNLSLNTVYSWNGAAPPTSLTLTLIPKADGTLKGTSVTTLGVFYNQ